MHKEASGEDVLHNQLVSPAKENNYYHQFLKTIKQNKTQSASKCKGEHSYNLEQNRLSQIAKIPIFTCHPGKNGNREQMNARSPIPSSNVV